jgi:E3 ubiquitin-protein ligase TRIP12
MRLRLVADESSDIPRAVANMTVSIQAIATFQALNDYLRPRLSGMLPNFGSSAARLSAMLAMAEARASAFMGSSSTAIAHDQASSNPIPTQKEEGSSKAASTPAVTRRRSQRLSAKKSNEAQTDKPEATAPEVTVSDDEPPELSGLVERDITEEVCK